MSDLKEMECHMECLCLREKETQFCLKKHVLGQMSELTVEGKKKVDNGKGNGSNDTEHHAGHSLCPYFTGTWDPLLNCAPPFPPPQQVPTSPPFLPQQVPVPPPLSLTQPAPTPPCFPQPPHAYVGLMPTYGPHHVPDAAPGPSPASWLSESLPASPSAPAVTSTPVGLRTRSHQQLGTLQQPIKDEPESKILTAPMVQVMGPTGEAAFVFRPWTYQDMKDNLHHLPDIADGGTFAAALLTFCQQFTPIVPELNRLLMMKLGQEWTAGKMRTRLSLTISVACTRFSRTTVDSQNQLSWKRHLAHGRFTSVMLSAMASYLDWQMLSTNHVSVSMRLASKTYAAMPFMPKIAWPETRRRRKNITKMSPTRPNSQ
ncbi:uncharacterized protein LOC144007491 [Festucalex cinctus]